MGKAARKQLKRRQEDARRQRRSNRNEQAALDDAASLTASTVEGLVTGPPADVKARQARVVEWLDTVATYPENAAAAAGFMRNYARIPDGDRRTDGEQVFPRMAARHREFALLLTQGGPHRLCEHLATQPEPVAASCIMCPDLGLFCIEQCLRDHASRHNPADEYRCDQCGQPDMRGLHNVRPDPLTAVPVQRSADDRVRLYPGAVLMSGLGICSKCKSRAGKLRARGVDA